MYKEILDILEKGLKDDGKSFYSNEEKALMLNSLFNEENKKAFDRGREVGNSDNEPWLTNGNNDFDQGPPTGWI